MQQAQQHNAAPPPASGGNNDNTAWLAELQGKPAGTPIASWIAPSQSSADGGEVGKYLESGTAALAQHPSALGPGTLQGLANTLNTVENAADSVVNSTIAGNNLLNMGANKIAGLVDHGAAPFGMVPSIPTSNWSKGAFVSHDPARPVEKAVTGTAIAVATTFGGGAAKDAAPALAAASDAAKGLMGKVSAIAEKVGGWIKGLFGKAEEKEGTSVAEGMGAPKHWNEPSAIGNRRIYQRNDLFDPKRADAAENKVKWVDENAHTNENARKYNSGASGARSNAATSSPQAPEITYKTVEGSHATVRFDGQEGDVLIDRKVSVTTFEKSQNQALRQSEALAQNGLKGRWEVPTAAQKVRAVKMLAKLGIKNITVDVVPK